MIRFLFYTDIHLAGETPRHRVDDFPRTLLGKLKEVYTMAANEGCHFVAFGGDFFNSHRVFSYEVMSDAMDIICDAGVKTYMVVGEHDLYGHSLKTYPSSTLAFVARRCNNIEILWEPIDLGEVVLYGKHEPMKIAEAMVMPVDKSRVNILVCHELITCEAAMFEVIDTSTLIGCPFDLVVSGDLHCGFETHRVGDTYFVNPGSLARRSTADAERWPQVAIIDIEKGVKPNIEIRRLECGKSGFDVFGESIAEVARKKDGFDSEGFAKELLEFEAEATDVYDLVQKAGTKAGIRKEVLEYLSKKRADIVANAAKKRNGGVDE